MLGYLPPSVKGSIMAAKVLRGCESIAKAFRLGVQAGEPGYTLARYYGCQPACCPAGKPSLYKMLLVHAFGDDGMVPCVIKGCLPAKR